MTVIKSKRPAVGLGGGGGYLPVEGTDIPDANTTINPGTDKASQYVLPALTGNRTNIVGTGGSPPAGLTVGIILTAVAAFTAAFTNGGTNGGTMFTFSASMATADVSVVAVVQYNSVDWVFLGFEYVTAS